MKRKSRINYPFFIKLTSGEGQNYRPIIPLKYNISLPNTSIFHPLLQYRIVSLLMTLFLECSTLTPSFSWFGSTFWLIPYVILRFIFLLFCSFPKIQWITIMTILLVTSTMLLLIVFQFYWKSIPTKYMEWLKKFVENW